jgi:hypothetical protein
MDRLDLELYADRIARHADRLSDELGAARLRLSWHAFEARSRERLGPQDTLLLESIGVLVTCDEDRDRTMVRRRERQLEALGRLQVMVEEAIAALRAVRA